jgi:hypothetical protein
MLSAAACGSSPPRASDPTDAPREVRRYDNDPLELEGELAAALAAGVSEHGVLVGGDMRGGNYIPVRSGIPVLVGNRIGYDFRLRLLYGRGASDAFTGHGLLGFTPSIAQQLADFGRDSTGARLPSILGLIAPETGAWFRVDGPTRFYLGWRAPIAWLPTKEAGLELVPSFVWAPAGAWLATLSAGGFWR